MSEKISEMTAQSAVSSTAVLPIVQDGSNWKTTRTVFLSAIPGEQVTLIAGSATIVMDYHTDTIIIAPNSSGGHVIVGNPSGNGIDIQGGGPFNVTINTSATF